ncbi:MAG: galactosyldiacylglycerol synthase [Rudaea sp.]|uniref:MGDG synthase family glycosyltransferase n=1 Tax=unclassified Rudaea TaxID=2627037 RepID=UPI0010F45251|nr:MULTISPECIES: glycosyltransferase [unclassified Rudaea]MBN8886033.1 galactosyldiacylglycerol synthase [Rudaea sp.]MBR0343790.1 galactosyldiacylglycerol synthase [Rudaea sp.]
MTRLLILSVSAGNGHVRAAQALEATARALPDAPEVAHLDAMDFVAPGFRKMYTDWYIKLINEHPGIWEQLHHLSDTTPHSAASQRLRRGIERLSSGALRREVRKRQPDAVICTHFLPAELLKREIDHGHLHCPVWLQVTDYDLHNMWLVPELAGYFAATGEVEFRMRARGLREDRLHVTGIPVMPAFSRPNAEELDRTLCARELGLDPARRVILIVAGGAGVGDLPTLVRRVLTLPGDFQIVAVTGRNAQAKETLDALANEHPQRLLALGFTDKMHKLMAASDLVVTKPGGLTVSECLAIGRPMLLISPIPGQEEHNAGFLMEEGAAWLAYDGIGLEYKVQRLMAEPATLAAMAARSRALGKPHAAQAVLDFVLGATR